MKKWITYKENLELSQVQYHLEYDDHLVAILTAEQYESLNQLLNKVAEQPPASDFTKKLHGFIKLYENEIPRRAEITFLKEACVIIGQRTRQEKMDMETIGQFDKENKQLQARLDRSEASLLKALEPVADWYGRRN